MTLQRENRSPCQVIALAMIAVMALSCGAPTKSAGDVASIFAETESLEAKLSRACQTLATRTSSPTAKDISFTPGCSGAGRDAIEFNRDSSLFVVGQKDLDPNADNGKTYVDARLRTQMWLNRSLLGLGATVGKLLADNKDFKGGEIKLAAPKNGPNLSGLFRTKVEIIEAPKLDLQTLGFATKAKVKVGDDVEPWLDNELQIDGQVVDDILLVTVKSMKDKPFEESLLHHIGAFAVIIPHANDVYVDVDLSLGFNKGTGLESAVKTLLPKLLGSALKPALDTLFNQ